MKVLRIITRLNVGGPARQVLALQSEMQRRGIDETLVAGQVDEGEADLAAMLGADRLLRVPHLIRPVRPTDDIRAYAHIAKLIADLRPDVVHTHLSKAGLVGRGAALRRDVPVTVHTFHGHVLDAYFGKWFGRAVRRVEARLAARTSALLAVGSGVRQDLIRYNVAPPGRVEVVPAGIDLSPFAGIGPPGGRLRSRLGIPETAPVVGFAGRLVQVKRIDRLSAVIRHVIDAVPTAYVVICGDGPDRHLLETARAELRGRVHLLGWLEDLREFYEAVNAVVLTSANEGTPISLIEAGASGRPVVSTDVGGVADVVVDGATGILCDPEPAALGGALIRLLTDLDLARRIGAAGRARALAVYSSERLATDLVKIYERELAKCSVLRQ